MSKIMSNDLQTHYQQSLQTLTQCLRIERPDGILIGLTAHDEVLLFEGILYQSGVWLSALQTSSGLAVGTLELEGIFSAAGIDKQALAAGLFDQARVEIFEVNYKDVSQGRLLLFCGFWGETQVQGDRYVVECRSFAQSLQAPLGELYSASCRAELGDARCGAGLGPFTHPALVTEIISPVEWLSADLIQAEHYFEYGTLRWESGANRNISSSIKNGQAAGHWVLFEAPPYPIQIGDTFSATAGCNKSIATCSARFHNTVNFRGEPFVPGQDQLSRYPDGK